MPVRRLSSRGPFPVVPTLIPALLIFSVFPAAASALKVVASPAELQATATGSAPKAHFTAEPVGIGGAGALFGPAVSPHDPKLLFVSCDMSGFYRSENGGRSWTMLDGRVIQGSPSSRVFFPSGDPKTVFQYGPGAGGWRLRVSHDRGKNWTPFTSATPWKENAVTAMEFDPMASERWLVGTAAGVYQTTNGGQSWIHPEQPSGEVLGLFIDPSSPLSARRCFAATPDGIFRSINGGATWEEASSGLPWRGIRHFTGGANSATRRISLYVTIPSRVVNGHFEGGVYRSDDGSLTWKSAMGEGINTTLGKQDEYGIGEIADYDFLGMAANNPDVIYTATKGTGYWPPYHFTVFRSEDGGRHWHYVFTGDPRFKNRNVELGWIPWDLNWGFGGPPWGFTVSRSDPNVAIYTNVAVYLTTNGGKAWRQAYTALAPGQGPEGPGQWWHSIGLEVTTNWHYAIDPHNPRRHAICYTDIGFARSEDGGKNWQWAARGSPWGNTFYQIVFDPAVAERSWAAASDQHDIPHWTQQQGATPGLGGGVVVSGDGMKSWKRSGTGLPNAPAVSLVLDPHSSIGHRRLWVSLWGTGVFRSDDAGLTWVKKSDGLGYPGNLNSYQLQLGQDGILYCAVAARRVNGNHYPVPGGLWRSRNAGNNWECITNSLRPSGMMSFTVDPAHPETIDLCQMPTPSGETGGVYQTVNGGQTWRKLSLTVPDQPYVHAFAPILNPRHPKEMFVTTEGEGTWVSEDGGETWKALRAIPFLTTQYMAFDPVNPDVLYITTFGGGVWKVTRSR